MDLDMLQQLTTYSFTCAWIVFFVRRYVSTGLVQCVQGLVFFVAVGVFTVYVMYGHEKIVEFYVRKQGLHWLPTPLILAWDWFCHFVPVALVGLPRTVGAVYVGYIVTMSWYVMVRDKIALLYPMTGVVFDDVMRVTSVVAMIAMVVAK